MHLRIAKLLYAGFMMNRRVVLGGAGALLAQTLMAQAQTQTKAAGGRKILFEHELPDLSLKDWTVTAVEVSYGPGEASAAHRHPGITIAYVLEGEVRSKVGDDAEKTYTVGQMFVETPRQLHAVSRNGSATKPAKLLAVMLAPKGEALTTPA
jgi:quercetin dioxygenase-like cupin family protein